MAEKYPMKYFLLIAVLFLSACDNTGNPNTGNPLDIAEFAMNKEEVFIMDDGIWLNQDSMQEVKLNEALAYAKNAGKREGSHYLDTIVANDNFVLTTFVQFGHLFSPDHWHLFIRRKCYLDIKSAVYQLKPEGYVRVFEDTTIEEGYIGDTIRDVNGDGIRDFMVHTYPPSGCCLRDVYWVRLGLKDGKFVDTCVVFVNPEFFPVEKVVRGVEYGAPGIVPMYKARWEGLKLKEVEWIFRDTLHPDQYIRTRRYKGYPEPGEGERLNTVPWEYKSLEGYRWFMEEDEQKIKALDQI
jgi:hypothetical protein